MYTKLQTVLYKLELERMNTSEALHLSKKGGLMYDSNWYNHGRLQETIITCTSPPKLSSEFTSSPLTCNYPAVAKKVKNKCAFSQVFPVATKVIQSPTADEIPRSDPTDANITPRVNKLDHFQSTNGKIEVSIQECQQEWSKLSKERAHKRMQEVQEHSRQLLEQAGKCSTIFSEQQVGKKRMQLENMRHIQIESEERRQHQLQRQSDCQKLHLKRMDVKLKTALQKKAEAEVEAEHNRRVAERQAYFESMMNVYKQIDESSKKVYHQLERYKKKEFLPPESETIKKKVKSLTQQAESLVSDARQSGASLDLVEKMHKIIESLMECQEFASRFTTEADRLVQEDAARKVREASIAQHHAITAAATSHQHAAAKEDSSVLLSSPLQDKGNSENALHKTISAEAFEEYDSLRNKRKALVESYQKLAKTSDPLLKKYRFDLQKAVNVPVNAISNQSAAHLLDKLKRLKDLLSGHTVDVSGRKVSVSQSPQAKAFVKDLLAKKVVKQSDEQVSSNFESAFALAAVTVALWSDFPDLGESMLAHFFLQCPFLVPYNMTKHQDQSNEEYYKSLGYNYESNGTIEKQDKYLRRMSGYMRLYAAILVTQPILNSQIHPHGLNHAWKWLARIINVEPQPDITATMLFDFLEVCGYALSMTYNKQFFKMIHGLHRNYFPKIEAVTPKGSGGPVVRLKNFLEVVIKTQRIAQPKGKLGAEFWKA